MRIRYHLPSIEDVHYLRTGMTEGQVPHQRHDRPSDPLRWTENNSALNHVYGN